LFSGNIPIQIVGNFLSKTTQKCIGTLDNIPIQIVGNFLSKTTQKCIGTLDNIPIQIVVYIEIFVTPSSFNILKSSGFRLSTHS